MIPTEFFDAFKDHLGKRLDDILENTVIEQHRSLKGVRENEGTDGKRKTEYVFIFEDGARVIVK